MEGFIPDERKSEHQSHCPETTRVQDQENDDLLSEHLREQKPTDEEEEEEEEPSWEDKPLNGTYSQQIKGVSDMEKS